MTIKDNYNHILQNFLIVLCTILQEVQNIVAYCVLIPAMSYIKRCDI